MGSWLISCRYDIVYSCEILNHNRRVSRVRQSNLSKVSQKPLQHDRYNQTRWRAQRSRGSWLRVTMRYKKHKTKSLTIKQINTQAETESTT